MGRPRISVKTAGKDRAKDMALGQLSVGAVVTNHNGGQTVIDCLGALLNAEHPLSEIIVVDNASSDGSAQRIAEFAPGVTLLRLDENMGPCVARNRGLGALATDLALLLDGDIRLAPDALALMLEAYGTSGALTVCPRILLYPETETIQADGVAPHFLGTLVLRHGFTSRHQHPCPANSPPFTIVNGVPSACFLIDRLAALDVGGFDELYFFHFEDLEFNMRLGILGHEAACAERAIAYHDRGLGTPELSYRGKGDYPVRRFYLSARNRLTTIRIYYRPLTLLVLAPPLLAYEVATFLFAVRKGFLRAWLCAWKWQVENRRPIADRRKTVQAKRKRSDADLLVGGPIPLAPGLVNGGLMKMGVSLMSGLFDVYWRLMRPLLR
jgi:GT2 family glycosyltransferase